MNSHKNETNFVGRIGRDCLVIVDKERLMSLSLAFLRTMRCLCKCYIGKVRFITGTGF